ncbi:MAG: YdeI/OmpD-associated family protein [Capsulimonadales bacterium]|nr:YdeI/OmpD-associated family protein [Capsulimonadales bacterium]
MEITETLYVRNREEWRTWLEANHTSKTEIWLLYPNRSSGRPSIPYNDAVEEALCFGWIDGQVKKPDAETQAQRFTPRKPKSNWSALNKERVRRLIAEGRMTDAGRATLPDLSTDLFVIPEDIEAALRADPQVWENFQNFPESYRRIRIGYVNDVRRQPQEFAKRLANLVRQTARNRMFGTMP